MSDRARIDLSGIFDGLFWLALLGALVFWQIADKRADCRQKLYKVSAADSVKVVRETKWCAP